MLLPWRPALALWKNSYVVGTDGFTCTFNYNLLTGVCATYADWQVATFIDDSWFGKTTAGIWPKLFFYSSIVDPTTYYWNATCQITG